MNWTVERLARTTRAELEEALVDHPQREVILAIHRGVLALETHAADIESVRRKMKGAAR